MSDSTDAYRAEAATSRGLDASLREGAQREIDATRVDLRERVLARLARSAATGEPNRSDAAQAPTPISRRLAPLALAASVAIIAGVAIRASFLATRAPAPRSDIGAFLARSLSSVEHLVAEQAPRQAVAAVERFVEQPLRSEARALLTGAQRALADFSARSNPIRSLPPLKNAPQQ